MTGISIILDDSPEKLYLRIHGYTHLNIAFLDLYDSSVNNAVIECIVRNTPVLVNKIPPIVELLGPNYPFYFNDLNEKLKQSKNYIFEIYYIFLEKYNNDYIKFI